MQAMVGAVITGLGALIFGVPGFVAGLIIACVYYGRTQQH